MEIEEVYVIFEDLDSKRYITNPEDTPVKIHKTSCPHYRKIETSTTQWPNIFHTYKEAENFAKRTGKPYRNYSL